MTDRGRYLQEVLSGKNVSVRALARKMAEKRAGETLETGDKRIEGVRRSLHRYFHKTKAHDVNDGMVSEISYVLGIKETSWPPKRPSKIRRLEAEVAQLRGETARRDGATRKPAPAP